MVQWIRAKTNFIITMTLALSSLALYVRTAAPTVLTADGGEFQFVPYMAGIAHPTGYPLYTMLGWLWSHVLPFGDVAYRMNLFSVWWAAAAVTLLYITAILFLRLISPSVQVFQGGPFTSVRWWPRPLWPSHRPSGRRPSSLRCIASMPSSLSWFSIFS
jgi:hypothetical protein